MSNWTLLGGFVAGTNIQNVTLSAATELDF